MTHESDIEFWKRILSTPAARAAHAKRFQDAQITATALNVVRARQAAPENVRPSNAGPELFGLARTIAAMKAKSAAATGAGSAPKELTGLARTIAAMKAKAARAA